MATKRDAEPGFIDTTIIVPVELAYEKPRTLLRWICRLIGHKDEGWASRGWSDIRETGNYDHAGKPRRARSSPYGQSSYRTEPP